MHRARRFPVLGYREADIRGGSTGKPLQEGTKSYCLLAYLKKGLLEFDAEEEGARNERRCLSLVPPHSIMGRLFNLRDNG